MIQGDLDAAAIKSNTFEMEWPPKSGGIREFPVVDRAEWFPIDLARKKINPGQIGFPDKLRERLKITTDFPITVS